MTLVLFAPKIVNSADHICFKIEIADIIQDSNIEEIEDFEDEITQVMTVDDEVVYFWNNILS